MESSELTTSESRKSRKIYRRGTLEYTKKALVMMFLLILWGDFCFICMESVHPSVLPFMLKHLGASNFIISLYVTTAISAISFIINPIISVKSDRHRSKWGRRRPFLLMSTPFVALFMILTAYSKEIGIWLHRVFLSGSSISISAVTIGLIGFLVIVYQFFHTINGSAYWYLFNDVVPEQFLGRFLAMSRVVATCASSFYSFFVYKYVEFHGKEILIIFALIYFIAFLCMGLLVKEGEYPPPSKNIDNKEGWLSSTKTFFKESFFTNSFYWKFYAVESCLMVSACTNVFSVFWYKSMGITLTEFGRWVGIMGVVGAALLVPAGILSDKKHPIRVLFIAAVIMSICTPMGFIFLNTHMPLSTIRILVLAYMAVQIPGGILYMASIQPFFMRILPHDRYGQFCSANSMVRSIVLIVGSALSGLFLDKLKVLFPSHDYYYRFLPFWAFFFQVMAAIAIWQLYKAWMKLGGDTGYTPPLVGKELEDSKVVAVESVV